MEIIIHHNIADLYKTLNLPVTEEIDFTILSVPEIHPQIPFQSPKLRADYFSFILTRNGSGTYYLDDNAFPFDSGSIYFTNPGHLKAYDLDESENASIITLTESFLRENVHPEIYDEFPFLLAEITPPKSLSAEQLAEFDLLYKQMFNEFEKSSVYKNKILGNLFLVFLLKLKEEFWLDYNPILEGNRNSQIVKSFKQLLDSEFRNMTEQTHNNSRLQVQDLAGQLHMHPNYLSAVIKSKTGRTISEWISKRTLSTAKSLLRNTALSAKEIAYRLGFSEPTHFIRFFRKHLNMTPIAYRNSLK